MQALGLFGHAAGSSLAALWPDSCRSRFRHALRVQIAVSVVIRAPLVQRLLLPPRLISAFGCPRLLEDPTNTGLSHDTTKALEQVRALFELEAGSLHEESDSIFEGAR